MAKHTRCGRLVGAGIGLAVWVGGMAATTAFSCADYVPPTHYTLAQGDVESLVPFLTPGNDTRANLLLLLADTRHLHPRLPVKAGARRDRYVLQTPFDFDTLSAAYTDRPPTQDMSGDFVQGAGDRCRSNAKGSDGYLAALAASPVPAAEKTVLAAARKTLAKACDSGAKQAAVTLPANTIRSASGQAFATYLTSAARFYVGDFAGARQGFVGLSATSQPWLKEAARYMVARVDLNAAQAGGFGDWGEIVFQKISDRALLQAGTAFQAYLHDYPQGAYAVSARGLMRRVAWLGNDQAKLADLYAEALKPAAAKLSNISNIELVDEIDNKLLPQTDETPGAKPTDIHEPKLLAVLDLMRMRDVKGPKAFTKAELDAQQGAFAGQGELYSYLQAAYAFYDADKPADALKILGRTKATAHMSYLRFSEQVLRGLALEALHRPAAARAHWQALIPLAEPLLQRPAIELALAENYERAGEVAAVFAADSPIHDPTYREVLLTNSASPDLLRQRASAIEAPVHEKQLALYVLLFKELSRGRYQPFLDDFKLMADPVPAKAGYDKLNIGTSLAPALADFSRFGGTHDGYTCPAITVVATRLAADPHDDGASLCLGEFVRIYGYETFLRQDNPAPKPHETPPPVELSTTATQFPGVGVSRLAIYKTIINDRAAADEVRAYALYRAVRCFAPASDNECDETAVSQDQRRAWYHQLKTRYPNTPWAARLKVYW